MKRFISVHKDVGSWAPRGQIIAILYKNTAISIGSGYLPKAFATGMRFEWMCEARRKEGAYYTLSGFSCSLIPALNGAVVSWPSWYRRIHDAFSWRNYDSSGVLKSANK